MSNLIVRTVIAEDEPLARERLRTLLAHDRDVRLVAECADGESAVQAIEKHAPDLLFLDVQMPELDGFEVLRAVNLSRTPAVIFVTAYDRYALKAFEANALDYLLKPFDRERFEQALARAKARIASENGQGAERLLSLLEAMNQRNKYVERLVIRSGGRVTFLSANEIDWIETAGNYLQLHAGRETHLLRETMNELETKLDPTQFVRTHRSSILNLRSIKELEPAFHGDYIVVLKNGSRCALSRNYRTRFCRAAGITL